MAALQRGPWFMLLGEQKLPIADDQWKAYDGDVPNLLSEAYSVMLQGQGGAENAHGKLMDLSSWTEPPLPYFIYKGRVIIAVSPHAPEHLRGKRCVAGYPCEIWDEACRDPNKIPASVRGLGAPQGYFYQVAHDSEAGLKQLEESLEDPTGRITPPAQTPRRRVVLFVRLAQVFDNTRRFAKLRTRELVDSAEAEDAPRVVEHGDAVACLYEWWAGPAPPQAEITGTPEGRWRAYHPKVCKKLELQVNSNPGILDGSVAADVDGVRYSLQHIDKDRPFDYCGKPSREEFLARNIITIDHPCFEDFDRLSQNCFVQFQKGNPHRRRPARRRPDAAEIAKSSRMTGEPCCVCLSEDGQMTGCRAQHVVCKRCLRAGLRSIAGDVTIVDNLMCGCFSKDTRKSLLVLADLADTSFQESLEHPPTDNTDRQDFDAEVQQTRHQFDLGTHPIPTNIYNEKITQWFATVHMNDVGHLYYPCSHPACSAKMENWILKEDFERFFQAKGNTAWTCKDGHVNSVLPAIQELDDMNRNLMLHPEHYTMMSEYSNIPLRRYRLCPECVQGGMLMLAMHGGECKQWPGYGKGHQHVFCFACTRKWGPDCNHIRDDCHDPGLQQVRILRDALQIGFVDSAMYLAWLNGEEQQPPPTRWPDGSVEDGFDRQRRLDLTDIDLLRNTAARGTT